MLSGDGQRCAQFDMGKVTGLVEVFEEECPSRKRKESGSGIVILLDDEAVAIMDPSPQSVKFLRAEDICVLD